jgi:hypothetical protein
MPQSIDVELEATAAQAMLVELEAYLKSDITFWQTAPNVLGDRMPKLTVGGLLESLIRAEAAGAGGVPSMREKLKTIKAQHLDRYLTHAGQEAGGRLDAWSWYLDDYLRNPADTAGYYPNEVRARLKAELLLGELEAEGRGRAERARASALDGRVRASLKAGPFVWDERLQRFFPPDRFWWLYRRLPVPKD